MCQAMLTKPGDKVCSPEDAASLFSRLLYLWPNSLFSLAKRQALQSDDLWTLPPVDQAEAVTRRFSAAWSAAAAKQRALKQDRSIGQARTRRRPRAVRVRVSTHRK